MSENLRNALSLVGLAAVLLFAMPRTTSFSYDYRRGGVWEYETLYAQFDFPILKTEEQMVAEQGSASVSSIPYYRFSNETVNKNLKAAESLELGDIKADVISKMSEIYSKGIVLDEGVQQLGQDGTEVIYVQKDKRAVKRPVEDIFKLADARARLYADMTVSADSLNVDSLFRATGLYNLIVPNLFYDAQTTSLINADNTAIVSPTMGYVNAGQLIVSNGEIITPEVEQMLDSYKKEYEANIGYDGPIALLWLGNVLVALMLSMLFLASVKLSHTVIGNDRRYWYLVIVFLLTSLMALVIIRVNESLLYMMPFTLGALFLRSFFKTRKMLAVYAVSLLPLLVFAHQGVVLFVIFLAGGFVSMHALPILGKGSKQFIMALLVFVVYAFVFMSFYLINAVDANVPRTLAMLLVASLLPVAFYPLVSLFEAIFDFVTDSRLSELGDTSAPLIRMLEQKAPGTFQHSLQVMNMAEAAARSIDVNPLLLRAGALYHDIGKLNNPQCFVENESLLAKEDSDKYHSKLTPLQSAHDIICHVGDGIDIARKNHLPAVIQSFIRTHHGTTKTGYFWSMYMRDGNADPSMEREFKYPGEKPQTKEQIILMLCDSIEAASRTLKEYTPQAYSDFVEKIVKGKMDEGQFDEADISVRELCDVKEAIKNYLAQTHHERIVYPEKKIKSIFRHESRTKQN